MLFCSLISVASAFLKFYFKEEIAFIITKFKLVYIYMSQIRLHIFLKFWFTAFSCILGINKQSQEIKSNFIFSFWNKAKFQKLGSKIKRSMWPICSIPRSVYYKPVWKWMISTYRRETCHDQIYESFFKKTLKLFFLISLFDQSLIC